MFKTISQSLTTVLKWATVVATTAVVVITIQASADSSKEQMEPAALVQVADAIVPSNKKNFKAPWTPSAGFADLIDDVSPAVVHVAISGVIKQRGYRNSPEFNFPPGSPFEEFFEQFRNRRSQQPEREQKSRPLGIGSGFIISADGFVVTNHHVIKDADEIVVTLTDGKEYNAELIGSDNKTDLALLKLENAKNMPYVLWGDDDKSRVGDWVLAIGNPFGLGGSASTGIISARGRDIRSGPYDDYIQVDAAINRGNSGGPLFNLQGQVIGINTAIYSPNGGSVGIGFSIPANMAKGVIEQLKNSGQVMRGWIGVEIQALTDELAEGFERDNDHGALISNVVPGAPADKSGMQAGDIILSFNGEKIEEMRDLPRVVANAPVGAKYPVVIWRDGEEKTLKLKTAPFPEDDALASNSTEATPDEQPADESSIGASLSSLTDELREMYRLDTDVQGVLVLEVDSDGLAAANGLRKGDVINAINNRSVHTPEDVNEQVEKAKKANRKKIVVLLQRGSGNRFLPFSLEE